MENYCLSKTDYFQNPTLKCDFDRCCERLVFHLPEKLVGNQYLEVLIALVPPKILVPLPVFAKIGKCCLSKTDLLPRSHTWAWFWWVLWNNSVSSFTRKAIVGNQYLDVRRILIPLIVLLYTSFSKIWEALLMFNWS